MDFDEEAQGSVWMKINSSLKSLSDSTYTTSWKYSNSPPLRYVNRSVSLYSPKDTTSLKPSDRQVGGDHYKNFIIDPAKFFYFNEVPFLEASAIKYILRHRMKGQKQDIDKAIHYLELIKEYEYEDAPEEGREDPGTPEAQPHSERFAKSVVPSTGDYRSQNRG